MLGTVRAWLGRIRGPAGEPDPDQPVEVALVAHTNGPLAATVLERSGIRAIAVPGWNLVSATTSHARIMVAASDEGAARRVLEESGLIVAPSPRRR